MSKPSKKLVIMASGDGSNFQAIVDATEKGQINATVEALVVNKSCYCIKRAKKHDINVHLMHHITYKDREKYDQALVEIIEAYQPDFIILSGFMRILSEHFVARYQDKIINIHPALLPKYKGRFTHQRAIEAGEKEHGSTVHVVIPELDAGTPIAYSKISVLAEDTAESLEARIKKVEHQLYPKVIELLCSEEIQIKNLQPHFNNKKLNEPLQL